MSLTRGSRIGPYEIVEPLGEGGMGQVWRARDLRLQREVAIKVLPDQLAADPERLARFERESQILASLNHPHIATIHGVEDGPLGSALVMEIVSGLTLEERIAAGPLPVSETLVIARDIADALESAHERGVIHRDLKPANLKLASDGRVKVLDFGLAKTGGVLTDDLSRSPTVVAATQAGTLVGTAAYMAPEQARGDLVDRRADVWAFGCVLYEMLTGQPTFPGRSVVDVLGAIMRAEPDWTALPVSTPASVRRLLERCLHKDPRSRLRDLGDARIVLEDVIAGRDLDVVSPVPAQPARAAQSIGLHIAWGLALSIAALVVWAVLRPQTGSALWPLRKLEITVQDPIVSTWTRPALAPDGHAIAYGASGRLWVRRLDRVDPLELRGSVQGERPFWSADGTQVAFSARRKLWKAGAAGEEATVVCDLPGTGRIIGGVWRPDNVIVFSLWFGGLYQVPADGGDAKVLHQDRAVIDFHEPALLPDGRTLVLVPHTAVANLSDIAVLRDGRRTTILPAQPQSQVDMPRYSASGHLVYARQGANEGIWAVPFSPDSLAVRGEPFSIVTGDWVADVAADGTLVYTVSGVPYEMRLLDRGGALQKTLGPFRGHLMQPALSPDGGRVLVAGSDSSTTAQNDRRLWLYDVASGRRERFPALPEQTNDATPEWAPDGRRVVYVENRRSPPVIVWRGIGDGSMPQVLTSGTERPSFSPDGRIVAFARDGEQSGSDVWMVPFTPGAQQATPTVLLDGKANERAPRFSPDGRFLAYDSDESGRPEVYLRRYPLTAERWVVSTGGGSSPLWHRKGTELFYRSPDAAIMSVPVKLGPSPTIGEPRELFSEAGVGADLGREFDVSADGQRFLVIARSAGTSARITVVQNWLREFRK